MTKTSKTVFLQSLRRCKKNDDFIDRFYTRFFATADEVKMMFIHTNINLQKVKLLKSLEMIVLAIEGIPEAVHQLNERAISHDRHHLNVKPELYDYWLESLLKTVVECDNEYTKEVELAWREVVGFIVKHMVSKY
ncbi:MAG: hypothetical protein H6995_04640 [Pseudomonadales bacterium]|nr:hypothetical protein [Pseudomonadales bacterium]